MGTSAEGSGGTLTSGCSYENSGRIFRKKNIRKNLLGDLRGYLGGFRQGISAGSRVSSFFKKFQKISNFFQIFQFIKEITIQNEGSRFLGEIFAAFTGRFRNRERGSWVPLGGGDVAGCVVVKFAVKIFEISDFFGFRSGNLI